MKRESQNWVSRFIGFYRVSRPSRVNGIEPDLHRGDPCFGTSIQEQTQEADEVQQPLCMLATASGMEHSPAQLQMIGVGQVSVL